MWRNKAEADILTAVANGDKSAFTVLFQSFHQELGEYVFRLTRSKTISEEIVQDAFMKIWTHREELPGIKSFRAYLFTITRNHTFNTLRREARNNFLNEELSPNLLLPSQTDDTGPEKEALYGIVEKAVAQLPPQQQKIWRLNKEEGLAYRQIAEQLHLSPQTVKRHISLAMASVIRYVRIHGSNLMQLFLLLHCVSPF